MIPKIPKPGSKVRCINLCPEDALVVKSVMNFHPYIPGLVVGDVEITAKCNYCGVLTTLTTDQFWDHVREQLKEEELKVQKPNPYTQITLPTDAKVKRGCQKCDYTGFSYGTIPCVCQESQYA